MSGSAAVVAEYQIAARFRRHAPHYTRGWRRSARHMKNFGQRRSNRQLQTDPENLDNADDPCARSGDDLHNV